MVQSGFRLLMVDDSAEDVFLVRRALERSGVGQFFYAVSDGEEAITYLRGEGQYADREASPFPNAILCDLKMPGMDGFGFLRWLKNNPRCQIIPVVVFSSSWVDRDVEEVYRLGGNAFITKPNTFQELIELIQITYKFWSRCQVPAVPPGQRCG